MLYIIVFRPRLHVVYGLYTLCIIPSAVGRDNQGLQVYVRVCVCVCVCVCVKKEGGERKTFILLVDIIKSSAELVLRILSAS